MEIVTIDFETKSRSKIKKVGAYRYSKDPSTKVLCLAYDLLDGKGERIWFPGKTLPYDLMEHILSGGIVEAHNFEFEFCIWNNVLVPMGFPPLEIKQGRCSAAGAAALALPRSLEGVSAALNSPVPKDMEGRKLMLKMSQPRKPTKTDSSEWFGAPSDFLRLYQYCITDVKAEKAVSKIIHPLSPSALELYHLSVKVNNRGIYCDVKLCEIALRFADIYEKELLKELQLLTNGKIQTAKQTAKMLAILWEEGATGIMNVQAKTVRDALKEGGLTPKAKRILEIRQALGMSSLSKYKSMIAVACGDQRLRGTLLFHGASTGRYTGRLVQPQNMTKGTFKDVQNIHDALSMGDYEFFTMLFPNVFQALSSALRGMLCAAPGNDLIAGDFNAIEARIVLWLAGCETGLNLFRNGIDPYIDMAMDIYDLKFTAIDKAKRQLGKQAVLGCGFGMGAPKFKATCAVYDMDVSDKLAKKAVDAYRAKFPEVPQFWKRIEAASIAAVKTGRLIKCGRLELLCKDNFLFVKLPSGRKLAYYDPKITMKETSWGEMKPTLSYMAVDSKTKQWKRESTYGGKITENIVQGIAADLMTEAMFRVEAAGYPVILTVHDEIVAEILKSFGSVKEFEKLMSILPSWADGLPVSVEGYRAERFKKS